MCDCDDNPAKVYGYVTRKARKPHRCSECHRVIAKGEVYEEHSGLWREGGWETFRWCQHCSAAQKILDREIYGFCFCFSALWQGVADQYDWIGSRYSMTTARLRVSARRKWTHKRGHKAGQLMAVPGDAPCS
jgi:glutaredoxin